MQRRDSLILFVGTMAIVALASARLWIGVSVIALMVIGVYCLNRAAWKVAFRLDRFRHRFRELLEKKMDVSPEDKAFLQKCEDSILFPLAVPEHRRDRVSVDDIWHIDTLYREYCAPHVSWPRREEKHQKEHLQSCQLCQSAERVREHIEGALTTAETAVESARQTLVATIDGVDSQGIISSQSVRSLLPDWERLSIAEAFVEDVHSLDELVKSLWGKDFLTFDESDQKRESCRSEGFQVFVPEGKVKVFVRGRSSFWNDQKIYDELTREMEAAAAASGLEKQWTLYEWKPSLLLQSPRIRRVIGRRQPDAMFRELIPYGAFQNLELATLQSAGLDVEMVRKEITAAEKLIAREDAKDRYKSCYKKETEAVVNWAQTEQMTHERRYQEWGL